ncbi:MAG: HD-GYP domain-containing protein [Nitrospirales bacterium]|nr:HD-GYP domain-containing protein [Nitrospirales bacterium]
MLNGLTIRPAFPLTAPGEEELCIGDVCGEGGLSLHQFAESLGNAVDAKDSHTFNHSQHVAIIGYLLALKIGFSAKQAEIVHIAGHLHDIGKIGIPDSVLQKKGMLTEEEWLYVRKHPEIGAKIVAPVKIFSTKGGVKDITLCHHERFDGNGYPQGLRGNDIPFGARVIAVADTLSALLQDRPYRQGRPLAQAVEEVERHVGTQFDPVVVQALLNIQVEINDWLGGT